MTKDNYTPMGQSAPSYQRPTNGNGNRHHAYRHRHAPKNPRYAHKVKQQGKTNNPAPNAPKNAQNRANSRANNTSLSTYGKSYPNNRQSSAKTVPFTRQRADLSRLPCPIDFYHTYGLTLKGNGLWRAALCPFHGDTHPSLSINTEHGGYFCHVCGASGDMVGFYMARFGVSFVQACKDLDLYR
ncbi:CHC2 zinc finger [Moraxella cuniculi DSM 21768]|uniref:CHC2 zinc finger n=1 Tax=Moraxella cuniculi DSM 21768 TaxID=1122245 RepID=A0A1N7GBS8_9GAMM|nr:CHC2 zinc finger domain-containing protein [Moraxella cuniculi]OOS02158.1 molecular chaperone [Moraxella cuniculi]SIS09994.1 CHC2 zinc finger [Moraxella cuniculi DSM 21768]